jgi:hypothetical protein
VVEFQDCVGVTSAATGAELCNLVIRSSSSRAISRTADHPDPDDVDLDAGHSVWIRGGDLLVRDCTITCAIGNGVVIGARGAGAYATENTPGQMPRLVRCQILDGIGVGVCIECMQAKLIDCTISGHVNNVELAYSSPGTSIHGCTVSGASENGVFCYDEARATLMHCHISGGKECVRVTESSDISLLECEIHGGLVAGVSVSP